MTSVPVSQPVGLLRLAKVVSHNPQRGFLEAELDLSAQAIAQDKKRRIQIPFSFYSVSGSFIGGKVAPGTPVIIGQGEGGQWYFVSFRVSNPNQLPTLNDNELLIQTSDINKITLQDSDIFVGSDTHALHLDTSANYLLNKHNLHFSNSYSFTEASRSITGVIKRDLSPNTNYPDNVKLYDDIYDSNLFPIGLDPNTGVSLSSQSPTKNPPFVEHRTTVYEFAYTSNVSDDVSEATIYANTGQTAPTYVLPNRRSSRSDTLSLSLVAPNFLIETIAGTVVDIFGNILDLNRNKLVIDTNTQTLRPTQGNLPKDQIFDQLKAIERNSIAYHFELNARKDLTTQNGTIHLPDVNSTDDYARARSRFFFDIDKEGQFKLNIPASSDTGNIPLLVRYENYSTFGTDDNNNPNKLIKNNDGLDIYLDAFGVGTIDVVNNGAAATPLDRLSSQHIKYGTTYHDITQTCYTAQTSGGLGSLFSQAFYFPNFNPSSIPTINGIVSSSIDVSGTNPSAKAGGRSGSINLDGFLSCNIGANTIDRQSLWLDTAGGMVANFGRDLNNISAAISMDGDLIIQVGGTTVANDSRFQTANNAFRGGNVDLRVLHDGLTMTQVRISNDGVLIATPNRITMQGREVYMQSTGDMHITADNLFLQERMVLKLPTYGSI
jgi:hypothetical protein